MSNANKIITICPKKITQPINVNNICKQTNLVFQVLTFDTNHSMIPYYVISSNYGTSRKIITNNSTTAWQCSPNKYDQTMVQNKVCPAESRTLGENRNLNPELTSSTYSCLLIPYFQKYGFLDVVDNHFQALQRNSLNKKVLLKPPNITAGDQSLENIKWWII